MSEQLLLWRDGQSYPGSGVGRQSFRASIRREIRYLLAISSDAGRPGKLGFAGVAHSLGVCMIEDWNMARGKDQASVKSAQAAMPTFVDIKLSADDRRRFVDWYGHEQDAVQILTDFTDTGYRVGCSWSGEHQSYTVSVTCRSAQQPNDGLCMTSFAKDLHQAVCLAWFKHSVIACGAWRTYAPADLEGWG